MGWFSVGGIGMETYQKFDAKSNGGVRLIPRGLKIRFFSWKTCFLRFFLQISVGISLFYHVFHQKNVFSDHCASIWAHHLIRLDIFFNLRPLDSYLVQNWRFQDFFYFNSGPSEGLKIRRWQYYLVCIICLDLKVHSVKFKNDSIIEFWHCQKKVQLCYQYILSGEFWVSQPE